MLFQPITITDKNRIQTYMSKYGEGSCQHSFAASICMKEKYGDQFAEQNGWLAIYRSAKSVEGQDIFLFPFGNEEDEVGFFEIMDGIFETARNHGAKVVFQTITENAAEKLQKYYPGRFRVEACRDYYEYLYTSYKLAELPGKEMASKRYDVNTFFRDYGEGLSVEVLKASDLTDILAFQKVWLLEKEKGEEDVQLELENNAIEFALKHFHDLDLSGIVVRISGKLVGYAYGTPLSDSHYDVMIEKGDRNYTDIYKILNRDLVRLCCRQYTWINREEDVGVEGLRKAKLSYKPDLLMPKYIAAEI